MSTIYSPLEDKTERDSSQSGEDYEALLSTNASLRRKVSRKSFFWYSAIFGSIAAICLVGLGVLIGSHWFAASANEVCPEHVQNYSPILKDVDTSIQTVKFDGSFINENSFRKQAGPEVDAAWASIGVGYRGIAVPASEASRSGLTHNHVKINQKYGGGFPANVEGLHHLHCLNLVRQSLYYNYEYYHEKGEGAFVNEDHVVKHHVSHCLDIIRQQLMCQPDTGVLGQIWWDKSAPQAFVDFNTEHKCKNFDTIRQWAEERQLPAEVPFDFLEPPNEADLVYDSIP